MVERTKFQIWHMSIKAVNSFILRAARKSDEMLEPYDGKLSRTVLRRESGSNLADLVDYGELSRNLGGTFIDMMSGRYIINVLEPKQWTTADYGVDEKMMQSLKHLNKQRYCPNIFLS